MKIAVSSTGKELNSPIDIRFGRCAWFLIIEVDLEKKTYNLVKSIPNPNVGVGGGAGVSAAQLVANEGVKAVITGNVGPRAYAVFQQLGIEVYRATGTVSEAVEGFIEGKLEKITVPGPMLGFRGGRGMGWRA